jgi:hypothetical protein
VPDQNTSDKNRYCGRLARESLPRIAKNSGLAPPPSSQLPLPLRDDTYGDEDPEGDRRHERSVVDGEHHLQEHRAAEGDGGVAEGADREEDEKPEKGAVGPRDAVHRAADGAVQEHHDGGREDHDELREVGPRQVIPVRQGKEI